MSIWTGGADWLDILATRFAVDTGPELRRPGSGLLAQDRAHRLSVEGMDQGSTGASDDASLIVITRHRQVAPRQ
jgi:hypothetical protein